MVMAETQDYLSIRKIMRMMRTYEHAPYDIEESIDMHQFEGNEPRGLVDQATWPQHGKHFRDDNNESSDIYIKA